MELTLTLVVGAILMLGMLPLISTSAKNGADMQLQMADMLELQSLMERISAYNSITNLTMVKSELGPAPGTKNHATFGNYYLHASDYVHFDAGNASQTTNGATDYLEIKVSLDSTGPYLTKILHDEPNENN